MGKESARPPTTAFLGAGVVATVLLVVLAFGITTLDQLAALMLCSAVLVMAAIVAGIRLHRPAFPAPWWLILASIALALVGNVVFVTVLATTVTSDPAAINIIYGVTYPILCAGVALLPNHRRPGALRIGMTEAAIITCAVSVVWWMLFVDPRLIDTESIRTQYYLLVEPFLDLILLGFGVRLWLLGDARCLSYRLVAASCAARLVADTAYLTVGSLAGFATPTSIVGWVVCNGLLALAVLHPSMRRAVPLPADAGHGMTRFYLGTVVATPTLTGIFLLHEGVTNDLNSLDVVVPCAATAVTSALVVHRMRQLNRIADGRTADLETALHKEAELQRELRYRSEHDLLTGLPGRTVLHDRLAAVPDGEPRGALLLLDLDGFKDVNDRFGYAVGDELLVRVSERLGELSGDDLVARMLSDEFAVLLRGASLTDAWARAEQVLSAMRRPLRVQGNELLAPVSIGLRELEDGLGGADAVQDAYLALHAAKEAGRNRLVLYDPELREKRQAAARLVERLGGAIARDELRVHYQPLIRLEDEHIAGVEALIRWQPAGEKMIPPDRFIGAAEDSGLIVPIGAWILREACRTAAEWHHRHGTVVSVNVSPRQLREPDFEMTVLDALRSSGLPPQALILEITEGVLVDAGAVTEQAIGHLSTLRTHGVRVAVDDFGTGYSSLAYLRDLPIDHIKIDKSFMPAPDRPDPAARTLVKAIIDLAAGLSLGTIAEGVETAEQVALLRELGCERVQGFYYSRPLPEPDANRLILAAGKAAIKPAGT